jgi:tetratricopeptide (TPR) repeat protein
MRLLRALPILALLRAAPALADEAAPLPDHALKEDPALTPQCADKPEVCGRQAFERGVSAYRDGDYQSAIREFRAALEFKWHPSIALNLGLAEAKAGQYLAAIREFDAIVARADSNPKVRDEATKERERAAAELASIEIDAGEGGKPVARVDGAAVDASAAIMVDPGPHHVEIEVAGGGALRRDLTLSPREHLRLSIDRTREIVVVPDRQQQQPKPAPSPAAPPLPPPPTPRHGVSPVWFFVGAGATVVAGAVATWSAFDTKSAFDSYQTDLPRLGQAEANQRVDDGHSLEARTNILWAFTGVLALGTTAVGVFLVDWKPSQETAITVGPGMAAFRGRF